MKKIGVIGAGAWGTAIASCASRKNDDVVLWAREEEVVSQINDYNENKSFLPNVKLSKNIKATNSLKEAVEVDAVFLVVPSQFLRQTCQKIKEHISPKTPVVICSKGIEIKTGLMLDDVFRQELEENPIAVLSGPTFAIEVANNLPSAITFACKDKEIAKELIEAIGTPTFRPYLSEDVKGALVGGSIKNVLAIACGIVYGKKLGDNARSALITRGLQEIKRLSLKMGAKQETVMGLSGLGDLILTASSTQSRNFSLGLELGQGKSLKEILDSRNSVAEGVYTAKAVKETAENLGVDMPLCMAVNSLLHENAKLDDVIKNLLNRPFKKEISGKKI